MFLSRMRFMKDGKEKLVETVDHDYSTLLSVFEEATGCKLSFSENGYVAPYIIFKYERLDDGSLNEIAQHPVYCQMNIRDDFSQKASFVCF